MTIVDSIPLTFACVMLAVIAFASVPFWGSRIENGSMRMKALSVVIILLVLIGYGVLLSFALGFPVINGIIGGSAAVVWLVLQFSGLKVKRE